MSLPAASADGGPVDDVPGTGGPDRENSVR